MRWVSVVVCGLLLGACGGGGGGSSSSGVGGTSGGGTPTTYAVTVEVRGLADAGGVVLALNGANTLTASADGRYTFSTALAAGAQYSTSVQQQPVTKVCAATNGTGVVNAASPPVVAVECLDRVVTIATGLWIVTRAAVSGFEQNLYVRSRTAELHHFRIRAGDGGLDAAGPTWNPFPSYFGLVSFEFSLDGTVVYADDQLGNIVAATINGTDGVLAQTWSSVLAHYSPSPPVLFGYARLSPDGQRLYQSFIAIINGVRSQDLWVGTVAPGGLSVLSGLPFPIGADGPISFEPSGRFFARAIAGAPIEVYRAFSPTIQSPQLVASYPLTLGAAAFSVAGEERPSRWLWEIGFVVIDGPGTPTPQAAAQRWRDDGSIEPLGGALAGVPIDDEIAATVCMNNEPTTQRISSIGLLPATSADFRYALQRQDTRCRNPFTGPLVDIRALALFLVRVKNGQSELTKLAVDSLPGFSDLGVFGVAHPAKPWLYIGSKFTQRVYAYSVDASTGAVQPLTGSPFNASSAPAPDGSSQPTMIIDPTGRYLYMARYPETASPRVLHAFSIDQTTGALTAVATYTLL